MRLLFGILLATLVSTSPQAQEKINKWSRYAVGSQEISLVFATHIDRDCKTRGESKLAIVTPPAHGKLASLQEVNFSNFSDTGSYAKCNEKKIPGLKVNYTANEGFKGKDKLVFLVIYVDGDSRRYEINMTVW